MILCLTQNYLIIQITEVQHAIDQLKRKLDTDKMKLILEVKVIYIFPKHYKIYFEIKWHLNLDYQCYKGSQD